MRNFFKQLLTHRAMGKGIRPTGVSKEVEEMERTVQFEKEVICYQLERKSVKNLNLRVRRDGTVYVSASPRVPLKAVDGFVISKGAFILSAQKRFREMAQAAPRPMQYVTGETLCLLGRAIHLQVEKGERNTIFSDGDSLRLYVKDPDDFGKKERMAKRYLEEQCRTVFSEILAETYPVFEPYGVAMPTLRIRDMKTQWGSCLYRKGIITLNKHLLEAPHGCISYVMIHEFCHFIHPNHSKNFYSLLTELMPDWMERKKILNSGPGFWLGQ